MYILPKRNFETLILKHPYYWGLRARHLWVEEMEQAEVNGNQGSAVSIICLNPLAARLEM